MENYICPYCKEKIEFEEGKCKVCALKAHFWECKEHRKLNTARKKLFDKLEEEEQ